MSSGIRMLLVALILVSGALLRAQHVTDPWMGGHNGWGGAFYGNIARNFVKYGYLQTRFAPVTNGGVVTPERFTLYYHYPPLMVGSVSLSYLVFGIHEWSARLVPWVFSVGLMGLVYLVVRTTAAPGAALVALLFMAVIPGEIYYGSHVEYYSSPALFFSLLAVYGYLRWLGTGTTLGLAAVGVLFGCLTSWYTYFAVLAIVADWYVRGRHAGLARLRGVWVLPACAFVVFLLFLLHRQWALAGRAEVLGTLSEMLATRLTWNYTPAPGAPSMSIGGIWLAHAWHLIGLYGLLLGLVAVWAAGFLRDLWRGQIQVRDRVVVLLLAWALAHHFVFPSLLAGHAYMVRAYAPAFAVAAAFAFMKLWEQSRLLFDVRVRVVAFALMIGVIVGSSVYHAELLYARSERLYAQDSPASSLTVRTWARAIQRISDESDVVLVPFGDDTVLQYYWDREMTFGISSRDKLPHEPAAANVRYIFACPTPMAGMYAELLAFLDSKFERQVADGLIIYVVDPLPTL